ncbi:MAG: FxsA family protein [Gammaproteobacteria bacterium]|nr:FxsA family protein [Gammaproteobacteria bacterium]MCY4211692.1 FxsA family protein [Gammaproteobacteria bacterium]MCY4281782.1 FxsA family protein [Gammaproteobacteria bacterium]MCY4337401.1 FxsA family protein [Gammaproteobacteria bacterium]
MFRILFLLFVTVPLVEIYFLIQVGQEIGALATVLLCILTAALGAILLRIQGLLTLMNAREKLRRGEIPADNLLEGLILLGAAVLLLTPGFVTDVLGFLCLVPPLRSTLALRMLHRACRDDLRRRNIIVEGEFWEEDNHRRLR